MPKALHRDFPLLSNLLADIRLLGFPAVLNSFAGKTSSSRANMYSSHIAQAMIIKGAEFPQLYTGVEYDLGRYEYSTTRRTQDGVILKVIPKYTANPGYGGTRIRSNPHLLVIYRGLDDNRIHYVKIERYAKGTDGFGYENVWHNTTRLYSHAGGPPDVLLPKDMLLSTSPAHKGNRYCLGTNLNVAYMTMMDTIDDAMLISESAAAKFETTEVATVIVNIRQDSRPVNLYGTLSDPKFMPDIGEIVGPHGFLCAFRPMETDTYAADLDETALLTPKTEIDDITSIKAGAMIADIDFIFNPQRHNFGTFGAQMEKYNQGARVYWDAIIEVYNTYKDRFKPSKEFNTLVTSAITHSLMLNPGKRILDLRLNPKMKFEVEGAIRKQAVGFIQAVVTYVLPRSINKAFKITDRHGGKGVVCRVCPDDEMPVDDRGVRAHVVIGPGSPVARMNFGTLDEPAINRVSEFVRRRCEALLPTDPQAAINALLSWYDDVNPNYGQQVRRSMATEEMMLAHVRETVAERVNILVPPFLNTITPDNAENIDTWTRKWDAEATPVTYSLHDRNGGKRTYRTQYPVLIGAKYIYCLSKLPYPTSAGVSHVSHYGIPIKPGGNTKHRFPTRMVPIRFGEDENRVLCMDAPEAEVVRLNNLQSNSPSGLAILVNTLLTAEYPTAIRRIDIDNETLARTSAVTAMFHHTTSVLGIETRDTLTTMEPPPGLRNDSSILGNNDIRLGSGFSDGAEGADRSEERWLESIAPDADELAEVLLEDIEAIAEELGLTEELAETGAEDLLDLDSDPGDDGLASTLEEPRTEEDIDPLHDPNV